MQVPVKTSTLECCFSSEKLGWLLNIYFYQFQKNPTLKALAMCLKISLKRAGNEHVFLLTWVLKSQLDPSHNSAVSYLVLVGFTHWEEEEMFFKTAK